MEVVDRDVVGRHYFAGNFVIGHGVFRAAFRLGAFGVGGGGGENELGVGFFEFGDDLRQIFLVKVGFGLAGVIGAVGIFVGVFGANVFQVVEAPVEVDKVPLLPLKPAVDVFDAFTGAFAIFGIFSLVGSCAENVGFAFEFGTHLLGVAD